MAENGFIRSRWKAISLASLSLGLVLGGCGGDDDDDTNNPAESPTPVPAFLGTLSITAPVDGAQVPIDFDTLTTGITHDVNYFTLAPEGGCEGSRDCGRVNVVIDDGACNKDGYDYNNSSSLNPVVAYFGECANPLGTHKVTLKLVYDDGRETGVEHTVTITTTLPQPVAQITDPNATTSTFDLPDDLKVPITFNIQNYHIKAAGQCGNTPNCGHVYLKIDDDLGNQSGEDYNAKLDDESTGTNGTFTLEADLSRLSTPTGSHTVTVSLRNDDGTPYLLPESTIPVQAQLELNILDPDGPHVDIVSPAPQDTNGDGIEEGPTAALGNDGYYSVPIGFAVENFYLSMDCSSYSGSLACGHVHVMIDKAPVDDDPETPELEEIGNAEGLPYNNAGAGTANGLDYSIDAHFYWVGFNGGNPLGAHTVRLSLHDDNHNPIENAGIEVEDSLLMTTTAPTVAPVLVVTRPTDNATVALEPTSSTYEFGFLIGQGEEATEPFTFNLPESCGLNAKNCVHFRLFIEDEEGENVGYNGNNAYNSLSAEVNSVSGVGTAVANFAQVLTNDPSYDLYAAPFRVGVALYKQDGTPYTLAAGNESLPVVSWIDLSLLDPEEAQQEE